MQFRQPQLCLSCIPRGSSSVRIALRHFITVLLAIVTFCVLLELLWPLPTRPCPPLPVFPQHYVTSECGYERRLGNVMFTFAAAIGIARRNHLRPVFDHRTILVEAFEIDPLYLTQDISNALSGGPVRSFHEYGRRGGSYDRSTAQLFPNSTSTHHVFLLGYFQSWRYFDNVENDVRQNFAFVDKIANSAMRFLRSSVPSEWQHHRDGIVYVGIHVRRGDMTVARYVDYGYTVPPAEYFTKAISLLIERLNDDNGLFQFVVCSDDIAWSRNNIHLPSSLQHSNSANIVFSDSWWQSQLFDLAVLSQCNHTIMSVGSFGWWAAWLANGTTIYYDNWPRPNSMLEYQVEKHDYFPPHWIPLRL